MWTAIVSALHYNVSGTIALQRPIFESGSTTKRASKSTTKRASRSTTKRTTKRASKPTTNRTTKRASLSLRGDLEQIYKGLLPPRTFLQRLHHHCNIMIVQILAHLYLYANDIVYQRNIDIGYLNLLQINITTYITYPPFNYTFNVNIFHTLHEHLA